VDRGTVPFHGGLTAVAAMRLTRALGARRYEAPKLTAVAPEWRGGGGGSY
jgi:hypothetical protein